MSVTQKFKIQKNDACSCSNMNDYVELLSTTIPLLKRFNEKYQGTGSFALFKEHQLNSGLKDEEIVARWIRIKNSLPIIVNELKAIDSESNKCRNVKYDIVTLHNYVVQYLYDTCKDMSVKDNEEDYLDNMTTDEEAIAYISSQHPCE